MGIAWEGRYIGDSVGGMYRGAGGMCLIKTPKLKRTTTKLCM